MEGVKVERGRGVTVPTVHNVVYVGGLAKPTEIKPSLSALG